jgi:hypothetical protein
MLLEIFSTFSFRLLNFSHLRYSLARPAIYHHPFSVVKAYLVGNIKLSLVTKIFYRRLLTYLMQIISTER